MYLSKVFWCWPVFYACDFYWVHACHPLFKDYPQVIHGGCMEHALLRLEVEVMSLHDLGYITDCCYMSGHICSCCDAYVIHVYLDGSSLEFVLHDDVLEDVVHHGLKCSWGIYEFKIHDCWLKKSILCLESCLLLVTLFYSYVVVPPSNVQFRIDMGVTEITYKVSDQGEWILVTYHYGIYFLVVLYWSQLSILLFDVEDVDADN